MIAQVTWTALLPLSLAAGVSGTPGAELGIAPGAELDPGAGEVAAAADTIPNDRDPEVIRTEDFTMSLGARVQVRYSYLDLDAGEANGSFGVRRGRFSMRGAAYDHFRYAVQLELAGGSVNLIDANIRYQIVPMATLWVGQGKAPFGRQRLTSSGNQNFVDRTVVDGRFSAGRQAGVALMGQNEGQTFEYGAGIYNGNGINSTNDNNAYMTVARAVWTPLGAYTPVESAFDYPDSPRVALGASILDTTNGIAPNATGITRFNVEGAFKLRGFNMTSELYRERSTPSSGPDLDTVGWYAQAGYLLPDRRNEIAVRYGAISPDVPGDADVIETGVAFSHYVRQHRAKIQADVRNVERNLLERSDVEFRLQIQLTL